MRVLGIDPGLALTGYGLVEGNGSLVLVEMGSVTTPSSAPLPERLKILYDDISFLLAKLRPEAVALEELFFGKNVRTAISVGQARGVIILAVAQAGIPLHEYTPLQVKEALTGYGRADKQQIQRMICFLLGLSSPPQPDDVADAVAVAICHLHHRKLAALL
ncbi:MAG: crossover junction endodeoxyribonuclease RuvC [Anaerolineae bacterium]|nr:crossover junction endodeoxyribonuclease RuvC [Anaerolineae bacterium]MDW8102239.1 crossover junction endodeoxyribonuclease RuvC [Anaerolineae bacterium]